MPSCKYQSVPSSDGLISYLKELEEHQPEAFQGEVHIYPAINSQAIAAGVRRVHAITGQYVDSYIKSEMDVTNRLKEASQKKELEKKSQSDLLNAIDIDTIIENQQQLDNIPFINEEVVLESADGLKKLNKKLNKKFKSGIAVFSTDISGNRAISVSISKDLIEKSLSAGNLAKSIAEKLGGGGGGKDDFAMAGTSSGFSLDEIKSVINETIKKELGKI